MSLILLICHSTSTTVRDGIIIGAFGGAFAGFIVWGIQALKEYYFKMIHKKEVYKWLKENISDNDGERFRSTRTIASFCNLTEDRVRYICSFHKEIHLSTGVEEDRWNLSEQTLD